MNPINTQVSQTMLARQKQLAIFSLVAVLFWFAQFSIQFFFLSSQQLHESLVRSFGFTAATLIAASLFSSIIFKFKPIFAKYWRTRRYLGVAGTVFMLLHVGAALKFYFDFDLQTVFFSLNPFQNAIIFGVLAEPILLILALTSTDWALQKIGSQRWKSLHRTVYLAFFFTIFHFIQMNPAQLRTLPGALLLLLTAATLLGQLYWYIKIAGRNHFRTLGAYVGFSLILLFALLSFLWWQTYFMH